MGKTNLWSYCDDKIWIMILFMHGQVPEFKKIYNFWYLLRQFILSADYFCKQFGRRSGPTERPS